MPDGHGHSHRGGHDLQIGHTEDLANLVPHLQLFGGEAGPGRIGLLAQRQHVEGDGAAEDVARRQGG